MWNNQFTHPNLLNPKPFTVTTMNPQQRVLKLEPQTLASCKPAKIDRIGMHPKIDAKNRECVHVKHEWRTGEEHDPRAPDVVEGVLVCAAVSIQILSARGISR